MEEEQQENWCQNPHYAKIGKNWHWCQFWPCRKIGIGANFGTMPIFGINFGIGAKIGIGANFGTNFMRDPLSPTF